MPCRGVVGSLGCVLQIVPSLPCSQPTHTPFPLQRVPTWTARAPPSRKGSLSLEDTFENTSDLGPLELMGRSELDLAPYGALRKSQSADSLNSVSSVSNTFGQDFTLGQVEVSLDYEAASHTLRVAVLQGKDLLEREDAAFQSCFMRVSLLPEEQIVGISRVSGISCMPWGALGHKTSGRPQGELESLDTGCKTSGRTQGALESLDKVWGCKTSDRPQGALKS